MKLLIAEDERELAEALRAILEHEHYAVDLALDGQEALELALSGSYDGILLDIMMPCLNGIEVLSGLREKGLAVPILMLTAKSQPYDKIHGLNAGADDYLSKPFNKGELLARVRALLRRQTQLTAQTLSIGSLTLDRAALMLSGADASIRLSGTEFKLLELLLQNPNRLVETKRIWERVWGAENAGDDIVWVHVSYLCKKLTRVGAAVTIRAEDSGYILEVP